MGGKLHPSSSNATPRLAFVTASLSHFLCTLVARKELTPYFIFREALETPQNRDPSVVSDIMESIGVKELEDPDGKPFIGQTDEIRIVLALYIDWYDSEGNYIGGTHSPTGGIYLVVLNLPWHLRYRRENMFPIFIPGAKEPTTEQLNHFLRPIVDQLLTLWVHGITISDPRIVKSRKLRAIVGLIVADMLAAKKVGGFASHGHRLFCNYCRLERKVIQNNFQPTSWPVMSHEEHISIATTRKNASTSAERNRIFAKYGIRYSELLRLPYVNMLKWLTADPMHAILSNVIQYHLRQIFGIQSKSADLFFDDDFTQPKFNDQAPDLQELNKGERILKCSQIDGNGLSSLMKLRVPALRALCETRNIDTSSLATSLRGPSKGAMIRLIFSWASIPSI
jgi:hypothetical protein